jgi:hypothetical protein
VLICFGLFAVRDGGIVRDFDVYGEILPFIITPVRVYKAKELMLFRSVTTSIEAMSKDGCETYNARKSGSKELSGCCAAF